jgi:hypothetical protein
MLRRMADALPKSLALYFSTASAILFSIIRSLLPWAYESIDNKKVMTNMEIMADTFFILIIIYSGIFEVEAG